MRRAVLLLIVCTASGGQDWSIVPGARVGPITAETTRQSLATLFPGAKIVDDDMELDEGMLSPATFVYKGEPTRELAIVWAGDPARPKEIFLCFGRHNGQCEWQAANGIRIGMRLHEIEAKNGHPFTIAGFGWNYGGNVTSWNGGALSRWDVNGSVVLTLDADRLPNGRYAVALSLEEMHAIQGDHPVSSDAAAMRKLDPLITGMLFKFR